MSRIRRRQFLIAAGALISAPLARPQPAGRQVRIAILDDAREGADAVRWHSFRSRLQELGYVEGRNVVIDARFSQGAPERLRALTAELVALSPDVIVVSTTPATRAAMQATSAIPIVFTAVSEPVETGLVASLARPGGNVTGLAIMSAQISAKWIEILTEIAPGARHFAFLGQASNQAVAAVFRSMQETARERNFFVRLMEATDPGAVDRAFELMVAEKFDGFMVASTPVLLPHRQQIVELAARHRLPAVYARNEYVTAGGLLSYAPDGNALFRRAADYVDRILRGAKASNVPVEQPTKFELVVNLKTAKALGISISQSILLRADRVIE